ncbi:hypothetical protein CXIVA_15730 [Clostridium sp. SY8519]|uniref:D-alanyl-lipoteichoic acid biosynthesis protein DltB n=1 Tax=Clostridium sp. (strain SY8519) TaxID=1042156 RepID=UPI0002171ADC|nr:D-alanyl-lipoteichoic acid biosynthesis protein DltB [Clostridium sp. SY8519]BAK47539.1 hypothetical protein CXIVA_15730 [Clostridium sp. SY8519]
MELFTDFWFFVCLAGVGIPAVILGILEKPLKYYGFAVSLLFLWLVLGHNLLALFYLGLYCIFEFCIIQAYLKLRTRYGRKPGIYWLFLILSLLPLGLNKGFGLAGNPHHIFAFIGISYMTFKGTQIVIEIYDGLIEEVKPFEFFYLLLFFPTILSGPIDRSRRFHEDLAAVMPRKEYLELVGSGIFSLCRGLLYKIVIAALFYQGVVRLTSEHSFRFTLLYMYFYGFYLFFDFAGYSLMAIGAGSLFGIRVPVNFNAPFVSKDIKEFWDRWHITLSHWFRDFLFSRIVMFFTKKKILRKNKLARASIAFLINMGIMGVWHGLSAQYIIYGLYHGVLLSLTEIWQKKSKFYKKHRKEKWFLFMEWLITFHLVMFGFLIFSGKYTDLFAGICRAL